MAKRLNAAERVRVIEALAAYAHASWSGWMKYLFNVSGKDATGAVWIPVTAVERWRRQSATPYAALPEDEKRSDREEAVKILDILIELGLLE